MHSDIPAFPHSDVSSSDVSVAGEDVVSGFEGAGSGSEKMRERSRLREDVS